MIAQSPPVVISQAAPVLKYERHKTKIDRTIADCLAGGTYVDGPAVRQFEQMLKSYLGVKHVVSCNSGTDALVLSLQALGVGPGDDVIVPALSAVATASAVCQSGARPVFVDVDPESRSISAETILPCLTPNVKAIIVVHLHGLPADLDPVLELAADRKLHVVEDCAQAIGTRVGDQLAGSLGITGAFSFYPTKNLSCLGDGGAIATNNSDLAARLTVMKNYGWSGERVCVSNGTNSRLDELQAAILAVLLPHLDEENNERSLAADRYNKVVAGTCLQRPPPLPGATWHQYALETALRDELVEHLSSRSIGFGFHYARGLHEEPFFQKFVQENQVFPNTERLTRQMLSLPIQPELMHHQTHILGALKEFCGK